MISNTLNPNDSSTSKFEFRLQQVEAILAAMNRLIRTDRLEAKEADIKKLTADHADIKDLFSPSAVFDEATVQHLKLKQLSTYLRPIRTVTLTDATRYTIAVAGIQEMRTFVPSLPVEGTIQTTEDVYDVPSGTDVNVEGWTQGRHIVAKPAMAPPSKVKLMVVGKDVTFSADIVFLQDCVSIFSTSNDVLIFDRAEIHVDDVGGQWLSLVTVDILPDELLNATVGIFQFCEDATPCSQDNPELTDANVVSHVAIYKGLCVSDFNITSLSIEEGYIKHLTVDDITGNEGHFAYLSADNLNIDKTTYLPRRYSISEGEWMIFDFRNQNNQDSLGTFFLMGYTDAQWDEDENAPLPGQAPTASILLNKNANQYSFLVSQFPLFTNYSIIPGIGLNLQAAVGAVRPLMHLEVMIFGNSEVNVTPSFEPGSYKPLLTGYSTPLIYTDEAHVGFATIEEEEVTTSTIVGADITTARITEAVIETSATTDAFVLNDVTKSHQLADEDTLAITLPDSVTIFSGWTFLLDGTKLEAGVITLENETITRHNGWSVSGSGTYAIFKDSLYVYNEDATYTVAPLYADIVATEGFVVDIPSVDEAWDYTSDAPFVYSHVKHTFNNVQIDGILSGQGVQATREIVLGNTETDPGDYRDADRIVFNYEEPQTLDIVSLESTLTAMTLNGNPVPAGALVTTEEDSLSLTTANIVEDEGPTLEFVNENATEGQLIVNGKRVDFSPEKLEIKNQGVKQKEIELENGPYHLSPYAVVECYNHVYCFDTIDAGKGIIFEKENMNVREVDDLGIRAINGYVNIQHIIDLEQRDVGYVINGSTSNQFNGTITTGSGAYIFIPNPNLTTCTMEYKVVTFGTGLPHFFENSTTELITDIANKGNVHNGFYDPTVAVNHTFFWKNSANTTYVSWCLETGMINTLNSASPSLDGSSGPLGFVDRMPYSWEGDEAFPETPPTAVHNDEQQPGKNRGWHVGESWIYDNFYTDGPRSEFMLSGEKYGNHGVTLFVPTNNLQDRIVAVWPSGEMGWFTVGTINNGNITVQNGSVVNLNPTMMSISSGPYAGRRLLSLGYYAAPQNAVTLIYPEPYNVATLPAISASSSWNQLDTVNTSYLLTPHFAFIRIGKRWLWSNVTNQVTGQLVYGLNEEELGQFKTVGSIKMQKMWNVNPASIVTDPREPNYVGGTALPAAFGRVDQAWSGIRARGPDCWMLYGTGSPSAHLCVPDDTSINPYAIAEVNSSGAIEASTPYVPVPATVTMSDRGALIAGTFIGNCYFYPFASTPPASIKVDVRFLDVDGKYRYKCNATPRPANTETAKHVPLTDKYVVAYNFSSTAGYAKATIFDSQTGDMLGQSVPPTNAFSLPIVIEDGMNHWCFASSALGSGFTFYNRATLVENTLGYNNSVTVIQNGDNWYDNQTIEIGGNPTTLHVTQMYTHHVAFDVLGLGYQVGDTFIASDGTVLTVTAVYWDDDDTSHNGEIEGLDVTQWDSTSIVGPQLQPLNVNGTGAVLSIDNDPWELFQIDDFVTNIPVDDWAVVDPAHESSGMIVSGTSTPIVTFNNLTFTQFSLPVSTITSCVLQLPDTRYLLLPANATTNASIVTLGQPGTAVTLPFSIAVSEVDDIRAPGETGFGCYFVKSTSASNSSAMTIIWDNVTKMPIFTAFPYSAKLANRITWNYDEGNTRYFIAHGSTATTGSGNSLALIARQSGYDENSGATLDTLTRIRDFGRNFPDTASRLPATAPYSSLPAVNMPIGRLFSSNDMIFTNSFNVMLFMPTDQQYYTFDGRPRVRWDSVATNTFPQPRTNLASFAGMRGTSINETLGQVFGNGFEVLSKNHNADPIRYTDVSGVTTNNNTILVGTSARAFPGNIQGVTQVGRVTSSTNSNYPAGIIKSVRSNNFATATNLLGTSTAANLTSNSNRTLLSKRNLLFGANNTYTSYVIVGAAFNGDSGTMPAGVLIPSQPNVIPNLSPSGRVLRWNWMSKDLLMDSMNSYPKTDSSVPQLRFLSNKTVASKNWFFDLLFANADLTQISGVPMYTNSGSRLPSRQEGPWRIWSPGLPSMLAYTNVNTGVSGLITLNSFNEVPLAIAASNGILDVMGALRHVRMIIDGKFTNQLDVTDVYPPPENIWFIIYVDLEHPLIMTSDDPNNIYTFGPTGLTIVYKDTAYNEVDLTDLHLRGRTVIDSAAIIHTDIDDLWANILHTNELHIGKWTFTAAGGF